MIVSVHQPQYLPWLGYFAKIRDSDVFVYLDKVQYKKREYQNRNRIKTDREPLWLTVPVVTHGKYDQLIDEVMIDQSSRWQEKHWGTIQRYYCHSPNFNAHKVFFEDLYSRPWSRLIDLNVCIIDYLLTAFRINRPLYFESSFNVNTKSTDRIIDICKALKADTYLSGTGGRDYLEENKFEQARIRLTYQEFQHPVYKQVYPGFESNMSAIDLLFNSSPGLLTGRAKNP